MRMKRTPGEVDSNEENESGLDPQWTGMIMRGWITSLLFNPLLFFPPWLSTTGRGGVFKSIHKGESPYLSRSSSDFEKLVFFFDQLQWKSGQEWGWWGEEVRVVNDEQTEIDMRRGRTGQTNKRMRRTEKGEREEVWEIPSISSADWVCQSEREWSINGNVLSGSLTVARIMSKQWLHNRLHWHDWEREIDHRRDECCERGDKWIEWIERDWRRIRARRWLEGEKMKKNRTNDEKMINWPNEKEKWVYQKGWIHLFILIANRDDLKWGRTGVRLLSYPLLSSLSLFFHTLPFSFRAPSKFAREMKRKGNLQKRRWITSGRRFQTVHDYIGMRWNDINSDRKDGGNQGRIRNWRDLRRLIREIWMRKGWKRWCGGKKGRNGTKIRIDKQKGQKRTREDSLTIGRIEKKKGKRG